MFVPVAGFQDRIKMARIIVTLKIMPESPETDLSLLENKIIKSIKNFAGNTEIKQEIEPVAFGLKALKIIFIMDEDLGSTEELENNINNIPGIGSVEVTDVRRTIG